MVTENQEKRLQYKERHPYRLVLFNDHNLHTLHQIRFTYRTFLMVVVTSLLFLIVGISSLIALTPLREYIPGYPSSDMRKEIINNALMIDSLEHEIAVRDKYFADFRMMLSGEAPTDEISHLDSVVRLDDIKFRSFNHDSVFQDKLAKEQFNLSVNAGQVKQTELAGLLFFKPLQGVITNRFDAASGHFGLDIVAKLGSRISSVLDGVVVFAGWTMETGYVIEVQHDNGLISVYKHNAELLKKPGEKVKAGEALAIMGNSGKETTGPHLHFEMWQDGIALDPVNYINF